MHTCYNGCCFYRPWNIWECWYYVEVAKPMKVFSFTQWQYLCCTSAKFWWTWVIWQQHVIWFHECKTSQVILCEIIVKQRLLAECFTSVAGIGKWWSQQRLWCNVFVTVVTNNIQLQHVESASCKQTAVFTGIENCDISMSSCLLHTVTAFSKHEVIDIQY